MFCPVCKSEYREGFTRCADCEADLVDKLPDEPVEVQAEGTDDDIEFVELLETGVLTDVMQIKSFFDEAGIRYYINGDLMTEIRPRGGSIVLVADEDFEKARELVEHMDLQYVVPFNPGSGSEKEEEL